MEEIINRVAQSALTTLNLELLLHPGERVVYDIKDNLFQGLILREKDFREFVKTHDWSQYDGKNVAIICSADAIVPTWAYMLLATKLQGPRPSLCIWQPGSTGAGAVSRSHCRYRRRGIPRRESGGKRLRQRARAYLRLRGYYAEAAARSGQHDVWGAVQHRASVQAAESVASYIFALGLAYKLLANTSYILLPKDAFL